MREKATEPIPAKANKVPSMERTSTPGIFRKGARYMLVYRDHEGAQRKRSCRTLTEARKLKAEITTDLSRGEFRSTSRLTLGAYVGRWSTTYRGRTNRGVREDTLREYVRDLELHVLPVLGRRKITSIEPMDIKELRSALEAKGLGSNSVRLVLASLRVVLASAVEDRVLRVNPAAGLRLAQPQKGTKKKHLDRDELALVLDKVPEQWRTNIEFLEWCGTRISEHVALLWHDINLDNAQVSVNKRLYRGKLDAPKSAYGTRLIPLSPAWVATLRELKLSSPYSRDEHPVFATRNGTHLAPSNIARVLKRAGKEAGFPWVSCHVMRHSRATFLAATMPDRRTQLWLGHHSYSFTVDHYVGRSATIDVSNIDLHALDGRKANIAAE